MKYKKFRQIERQREPNEISDYKQYKSVEKEYEFSQKAEAKIRRKYHKLEKSLRLKNIAECQWVVNKICELLEIKRPIVTNKVGGIPHYDGKFIVMSWGPILRVLLHELAHHIVNRDNIKSWGEGSKHHGPDYCRVLEMVWEYCAHLVK